MATHATPAATAAETAADEAAAASAAASSAMPAAASDAGGGPLVAGLDQTTVLLLSLLLPLLIAAFFLLRPGRGSGGGRGRTLLLFGPVGAGKTALFHQMRFGRVVPTVSSMEPAAASFVPKQASEGGGAREVHAVDVPGNGRLRPRLLEEAAGAAALVCVLDGTQLGPQAREAAGQLFEVLTAEAVHRRRTPLLVCVNKADAAGVATAASARKAIEQEIQRVRLARTTMEDTSGRMVRLRGVADDTGEPFSFEQLDHDVSFAQTSAAKADVAAILEFAQKYAR